MRLLSLCTGYGGLDIAVVKAMSKRGITTEIVAFAEIDPVTARVFEVHHPGVPNLGDVKTIDWQAIPLGEDGDYCSRRIDIITAGYPCQPFSVAGERRGVSDPRHLWPHILRGIRVLRPRFVFLENVSGHRTCGFDKVLGDLAETGMDARWTSVRASDVGAPHQRERLFILATYPDHMSNRYSTS